MPRKVIVIDCHNHVLGRVASVVAKQLLLGKKIVLVRTEELLVVGSIRNRMIKFASFLRKRTNFNPMRGPFHERSPAEMARRAIRGMLPKKCVRGREAFKNLVVCVGIPVKYNGMKKLVIPSALAINSIDPSRKTTKLGELATKVGWRYGKINDRLEEKRKALQAKWFEKKEKQISAFEEEYKKSDQIVQQTLHDLNNLDSHLNPIEKSKLQEDYDKACNANQESFARRESSKLKLQNSEAEYQKLLMQVIVASFETFSIASYQYLQQIISIGEKIKFISSSLPMVTDSSL